MNAEQLTDNIAKLRLRVRLSAEKSQRKASDILLLAVSKTRPSSELRVAHQCGLREFGESYLQEALVKISELEDLDLVWHFIGPIQSNKTRPIAEQFAWVHSVDRPRVARRLSEQRPPELPPLQVCVQVNISSEDSKSGVSPDELPALLALVEGLPRLELRGLMAIPAASDDPEAQQGAFRRLKALLGDNLALAPGMDTLSMGMSADLDAAIAEGATIIRVGTGIFGPRNR